MPHLLTIVVFLPLAGALALLALPGRAVRWHRALALGFSLLSFGFSLALWFGFEASGGPEFQFEENARWIPSLGIGYHLGLDGVALLLVMLTTVLTPIAILSAWNAVQVRVREFLIAVLVLETAMTGTFAALDLVLFYVFWEGMLVPMYLLIGIWGSENRVYATVKFFIYTFTASLFMLVAILYLRVHAGAGNFDYPAVRASLRLDPTTQRWLFAAFAIAFAVKVPMFPLHTWLPDAHTEAPTAGSVLLAGVLLKMGTFGFFRYALPLFPEAAVAFRPLIAVLAVIGIVYGALMCLVQKDMKRLVAYSSVSHLGFVMLGLMALTAEGLTGSVYQMLNHGVSTGALFLLVGFLYERRHTRLIGEYGGLARKVPWLATAFVVVTLSSVGLPGTNGFVGEFLILSGTWLGKLHAAPWFAAVGALGVILGAVYMLLLVERVFYGKIDKPRNRLLPDLSLREALVIAPLVALIIAMGLAPGPFLAPARRAVEQLMSRFPAAEVGSQPAALGVLVPPDRSGDALAQSSRGYTR